MYYNYMRICKTMLVFLLLLSFFLSQYLFIVIRSRCLPPMRLCLRITLQSFKHQLRFATVTLVFYDGISTSALIFVIEKSIHFLRTSRTQTFHRYFALSAVWLTRFELVLVINNPNRTPVTRAIDTSLLAL